MYWILFGFSFFFLIECKLRLLQTRNYNSQPDAVFLQSYEIHSKKKKVSLTICVPGRRMEIVTFREGRYALRSDGSVQCDNT